MKAIKKLYRTYIDKRNCVSDAAIFNNRIEQELESITLIPDFRTWALEVLNDNNDREIQDRTTIHENQYKTLLTNQAELDNLTKMRYRDLIDDDMFLKQRNELQTKITDLKGKLRHTEERAEKWLELTEKTFNFATYADDAFFNGGLELKKNILMAFEINPQIKAGTLTIEPMKWFIPIKNEAPALQKEYQRLELNKKPVTKAQSEALAAIRTQWRCAFEKIRTDFAQNL